MDRFIEYMYELISPFCLYLKSNMDRFIVDIETTSFYYEKFKIQYG